MLRFGFHRCPCSCIIICLKGPANNEHGDIGNRPYDDEANHGLCRNPHLSVGDTRRWEKRTLNFTVLMHAVYISAYEMANFKIMTRFGGVSVMGQLPSANLVMPVNKPSCRFENPNPFGREEAYKVLG